LTARHGQRRARDDQQNGPGDGYPNLFTQFQFVQIIPRP
jgi:hypothetical protein